MMEKVKEWIRDLIAYWRVPAAGDSVAYREYLMLSVCALPRCSASPLPSITRSPP